MNYGNLTLSTFGGVWSIDQPFDPIETAFILRISGKKYFTILKDMELKSSATLRDSNSIAPIHSFWDIIDASLKIALSGHVKFGKPMDEIIELLLSHLESCFEIFGDELYLSPNSTHNPFMSKACFDTIAGSPDSLFIDSNSKAYSRQIKAIVTNLWSEVVSRIWQVVVHGESAKNLNGHIEFYHWMRWLMADDPAMQVPTTMGQLISDNYAMVANHEVAMNLKQSGAEANL